jgi:Trk-type K+ transport system membrane component
VVTVIMMIVGGLGFLLLAAIVVGIVDALQASSWRRIAAERREQWESRHLQLQGRVRSDK